MKLRWAPEAELDRDQILDFIAADNPGAATKMDALFRAAAERAAAFPQAARAGEIPGTREMIPHRNYRLVYAIRGDEVWILALMHTSRRWPPVLDDQDN